MVIAIIASLWAAWAASPFLAPLSLALFVLALIWPVQLYLQNRLPRPIAVIVTLTSVIFVTAALGLTMVWAFGNVWQSIAGNAFQYQKVYSGAADWLEGHGILIAGLWGDAFNVSRMLRITQEIMTRTTQTMSFWVVVAAYVLTGLVEIEGKRQAEAVQAL